MIDTMQTLKFDKTKIHVILATSNQISMEANFMDYKIIFSDVDGMLLDNKHQMLESTLSSIRTVSTKNS